MPRGAIARGELIDLKNASNTLVSELYLAFTVKNLKEFRIQNSEYGARHGFPPF